MPTRPRRRRTAAALATAALTVATLGSCSLFEDDAAELPTTPLASGSAAAEPADEALAEFYEQQVAWRECRDTMECAELEVPLDYAEPDGEALTLALLRVPAEDEDRRVGSLVVNPGGPGGSGIQYASSAEVYFGDEVRAVFDIVGFDPRGVGQSTPVDCLPDEELDTFVAADPDPETLHEARQSDALLEQFGQGCLDRSGDLARHMSTEEAARDMDVLRAVLDQERLAFFGASYGTYLGATYADLFPDRVGRMVLDGAIDPTLGTVETSLVQAEGFEVALRAYAADCVEGEECYLGSSVDEAMGTISAFLERLDAEPISGDSTRELTQGLAVLGIWAPLYNRDYWSILDTALSQGLSGDGRALLMLADQYVGRGPEGYVDNSMEALYSVNCLDPHDDISITEARELEDRFLEVSPTFGRLFAFGLTACGSWPVDPDKKAKPLTAPGAAPILVIGTSRDPATPLRWAEALAEQLDSGVLVRRDGDGHTGYGAGNECVDDVVERYLVSGEIPEGDVDC